eukprot:TRINITY_DN3938_c0_g1_i2.p1 TRINITY_DN3938_c0_g1~~TRINITY_DN3938_c0_g1_i2.p1  ORF type:complete len:222 (+),score=10.90 TRINITY_DN3938_c0_g1_i2:241-906(+)
MDPDKEPDEVQVLVSPSDSHCTFEYPDLPMEDTCCCEAPPPPLVVSRRVGKFNVLKESKGSSEWEGSNLPRLDYLLGPCWPMMGITLCMIIGLSGIMFSLALRGLSGWWKLLAGCAVGTVVYCYLQTSMRDPGIIPHWTSVPGEEQGWRRFRRTGGFVPPGVTAGYCDEGQVLIRDYDHFCIWTGTAIGGGNMFCFLCFLKGIFGLLALVVVLVIVPNRKL